MAVTRFEISSRSAYEEGRAFGEGGAYERIDGVLHVAADPGNSMNETIVDLALAARDSEGRVPFTADLTVLRPVDAARANGSLLAVVVNRGRRNHPFDRVAYSPVPSAEIDPGDGFLLARGWTVAYCGWQWDVNRSDALIGMQAPQAVADGKPIEGQVLVRFQPTRLEASHLLADRIHQPYPAADMDDREAVLTEQDWPDGPRTTVPRERWRFARDVDGQAVADPTHIRLEGGFRPGVVYEVVYRTSICPVVGTGLLAYRDAVSFLKYGDAPENPCAGSIRQSFGFGSSQSGRFLRSFLYHGLNLDEERRQVFDGILPSIAGAWRGQFNHRYAQPSDQHARGFIHLPPFAYDPLPDPATGRSEGLLDRQRALGGVPKVLATNTAAEYWRGDNSLLHTTPDGKADVEPPADTRVYAFASTQHGSGTLPLSNYNPLDGVRGTHAFNVVDWRPLLRAALINLERWVVEGVEPPPSVFPRLAEGTAAPAREVAAWFRGLPTATAPDPEKVPVMRRLDLGPDAARGIGRFPAVAGEMLPTYVSQVDADGNETGGIRLPEIAVPVATYTGWNPRATEVGGEGQILPMVGSTIPFAATPAEREQTGDPRPSIAERYPDRAAYEARVREVTAGLGEQRYLLAEDTEIVVDAAMQRYDLFAPKPAVV